MIEVKLVVVLAMGLKKFHDFHLFGKDFIILNLSLRVFGIFLNK